MLQNMHKEQHVSTCNATIKINIGSVHIDLFSEHIKTLIAKWTKWKAKSILKLLIDNWTKWKSIDRKYSVSCPAIH